MITEILAQIRAPGFTAGIVLFDNVVVETAPRVRFMRRWSRDKVRAHCKRQGWEVSVIHEMQREDVTAPPFRSGITQHAESFEVVLPDGSVEFVYFDENPGRRAINMRLSKDAAFAKAQAMLSSSNVEQ